MSAFPDSASRDGSRTGNRAAGPHGGRVAVMNASEIRPLGGLVAYLAGTRPPDALTDLRGLHPIALQYETLADLWDNLGRSDWMLWLLAAARDAGIVKALPDDVLRSFACWCARSAGAADGAHARPVELAESFLRGEATAEDLRRCWIASGGAAAGAVTIGLSRGLPGAARQLSSRQTVSGSALDAATGAAHYAAQVPELAARQEGSSDATTIAALRTAQAAQARRLREMLGNPFRNAAV